MTAIRPPEPYMNERGFIVEFVYLQYPPGGWHPKLVWQLADELPGYPLPIPANNTLFDEPFTVITPDGRRFGCFRCRGKTTDYVAFVEWYAQQKGLLLGKVEGDDFVLTSGERFKLADCQLLEAYIVDKKTEGPPAGKLYTGIREIDEPKTKTAARPAGERPTSAKRRSSRGAGRRSKSVKLPDAAEMIALARKCLTMPGELEPLTIYEFKNDVEAHGDARQERLTEEFHAALDEAAKLLAVEFGEATRGETEADCESIPLCGVFAAAFWEISGTRLFLAAAHEDRKAPFLLMMGSL